MAKTKTLKQVRFLLSKGSTMSETQKNKLKSELHNKTVKIVKIVKKTKTKKKK
jgi:hypothetical protein